MKKLELKIKEDYRALLPPLPPAEYEALERSIVEKGQYEPIVANAEGIIVDGHNRFEICKKHGIEPKYITREFANALEEKRFVIESNLMRRQLTKFQRIEMALPLIEIERELAKERKLSALKKGEELPDRTNLTDRGKALEIVAKRIGVSYGTLQQALYIMEHAPEEKLDKVRRSEKSIYSLYRELKSSSRKMVGDRVRRPFTGFLAEISKVARSIRKSTVEIRIYGNARHAMITAERSLLEEWERESREFARHTGLDEERAPNILAETTLRRTLEKIKKANQAIEAQAN